MTRINILVKEFPKMDFTEFLKLISEESRNKLKIYFQVHLCS